MKKLTLVTITLLLIGLCFSGCSSNTSNSKKPYDSLNIEKDELEMKKGSLNKSNDTIILFFFGINLYRFERGDSMQDIWESPTLLTPFTMSHTVFSKSGDKATTYIGCYGDEPQHDSYKEFLYAMNTKKVFEKDVKVQNVYCFAENLSTHGSDSLFDQSMPFVYYVTNKGDFVLCRLENDGDTYLFPFDKFKEYLHEIYVEDDVEQRYLNEKKFLEESDEIWYGVRPCREFTHLVPSAEAFDLTPYIFEEIT